jgi:hypothetical protein
VSDLISAAGTLGRFLYNYIFGDDWTVAVVILLGLAATWALAAAQIPAWWLVPLLAIVMTGISIRRAQRRHLSRR